MKCDRSFKRDQAVHKVFAECNELTLALKAAGVAGHVAGQMSSDEIVKPILERASAKRKAKHERQEKARSKAVLA